MEKATRNAIDGATQRARKLLEEDFAEQLDGDFDVRRDHIAERPGAHLSPRQAGQRDRIIKAIRHKQGAGFAEQNDALADYLHDAAFTTLNRFVALKMLEARGLVRQCVSKGEESAGYREFHMLAPSVPTLPGGYRLYLESVFDELSTEVKVLFDRHDPAAVLWPRRSTVEQLLAIVNDGQLAGVWSEDETIGWVYQYFNSAEERRQMRSASQAPRNSRELAVRNQFFTPRYVVQFLTDNTLGRIWYEMRDTQTVLSERCDYLVRRPGETLAFRPKKDPRDIRVLDPACGSGHFLLYAFDLFETIYEEAYADPDSPPSNLTGRRLAEDYPDFNALRGAVPALVLQHNLHGVDIDARCAQIAQLALWMRAQRSYHEAGIYRSDRPRIQRSNVVVAEPLVADEAMAKEFESELPDDESKLVFREVVSALALAGDLGLLLPVEHLQAGSPLPGYDEDLMSAAVKRRLRETSDRFAAEQSTRADVRRRLFADDTAQGLGLIEIASQKYDVILMNPPFGAASTRGRKAFERLYPRSKDDIYAAFVERGIELLASRGRLGAITSRSGFFLSTFRAWREEILLAAAPPVVFADLGAGVLDSAAVETAAYCLEAVR